jgi:hypothetical protein
MGPHAHEIQAKAREISRRFPEAFGRDTAAKQIIAALESATK